MKINHVKSKDEAHKTLKEHGGHVNCVHEYGGGTVERIAKNMDEVEAFYDEQKRKFPEPKGNN